MNGQDRLAALWGSVWALSASWPGFLIGMLFGALMGALLVWFLAHPPKRGQGVGRTARGALALAPAFVACLLWGAFFGILAARHFGH